MKKNILYVSYYFPPHSGAGIQRPLRLVKKMAEDNVNIHVISSEYIHQDIDKSFWNEIPNNVKIYYLEDALHGFLFKKKLYLLLKLFTYISFPDRMILWYLLNKKKVLNICEINKIDIVITSSFPYSSHLFGNYLKKKIPSIKWIVDYRDAWSFNPSLLCKKIKPFFWRLSKYLERYINNNSDKIITVSEALVEDIIVDNPAKVSVLYNGYNERDFINLKQVVVKKYIIFFMGSLYADRTSELLIEPFKNFISTLENKDLKKIELRFIGNSDPKEIELLKKNIKGVDLVCSKYIPHNEVLVKAAEASLLLLLIDDVYGAKGVVTGKIFEYLKLFAPILGIVPLNGVAAKIISDTRTGVCFHPNDKEGIYTFLKNDFEDWKKDMERKGFNMSKNFDKIEEFSSTSIYNYFKYNILESSKCL